MGSKLHYCQPDWFQRFLVAWLIIVAERRLAHCESCAFIRSTLHYCQPGCFQRFFVASLMMVVRGNLLSL